MYKYEGLLVHQEIDEHGLIEIVETDGVRALHFGTSPRQSSMIIKAPNELHAKYARAMMLWLLFKEQPEHVLMVGVGGGLLSKYLLYHFPDCRIQAIEFRKAIIRIARRFFALPLEPRLKIKIGDGAHYIKRQSQQLSAQYDLIMIDAFDAQGMADSMQGVNLFSSCKQLLTKDGILVINLWGSDNEQYKQLTWELDIIFKQKLLFLPVRKRGNVIVVAFAWEAQQYSLKAIRHKARQLDAQYHIEFTDFIKDLKRYNGSAFKKVIKE